MRVQPNAAAAARRGVVLLVVLVLLTLFAVVAITFVFFSEQSQVSSRLYADSENKDRPDPDLLLSFVLNGLVFDTNDGASALTGHGLVRNMYDRDSRVVSYAVHPGVPPGPAAALGSPVLPTVTVGHLPFAGSGKLHYYIPTQLTASDPLDPLGTTPSTLPFPLPAGDPRANSLIRLRDPVNHMNHDAYYYINYREPALATLYLGHAGSAALPPIPPSLGAFNPPYTYPDHTAAWLGAIGRHPQLAALPAVGGFADTAPVILARSFVRLGPPYAFVPTGPSTGDYLYFNPYAPANRQFWTDWTWLNEQVWTASAPPNHPPLPLGAVPMPGLIPGTTFRGFTDNQKTAMVLRPIPWQQAEVLVPTVPPTTSFLFPPPEDDGGDVKNVQGIRGVLVDVQADATGVVRPVFANNDSYWIDPNFPIQKGPDGRFYKPLYAVFIMDLDGKLNVNEHFNNLAQRERFIPTGISPQSVPEHTSNQGMGPWEVAPTGPPSAAVTANPTETQHFRGHVRPSRAGETGFPGSTVYVPGEFGNLVRGRNSDDFNPRSPVQPLAGRHGESPGNGVAGRPWPGSPQNPPLGIIDPRFANYLRGKFYSRTDVNLCDETSAPLRQSTRPTGGLGLALPTNMNPGIAFPDYAPGYENAWPQVSGRPAFATYGGYPENVGTVWTWRNHPASYRSFAFGMGDSRFPPSHLEPLYRMGDTGADSMTSDIIRLCPNTFTTNGILGRLRYFLTTNSVDKSAYGLTPWYRGIPDSPPPGPPPPAPWPPPYETDPNAFALRFLAADAYPKAPTNGRIPMPDQVPSPQAVNAWRTQYQNQTAPPNMTPLPPTPIPPPTFIPPPAAGNPMIFPNQWRATGEYDASLNVPTAPPGASPMPSRPWQATILKSIGLPDKERVWPPVPGPIVPPAPYTPYYPLPLGTPSYEAWHTAPFVPRFAGQRLDLFNDPPDRLFRNNEPEAHRVLAQRRSWVGNTERTKAEWYDYPEPAAATGRIDLTVAAVRRQWDRAEQKRQALAKQFYLLLRESTGAYDPYSYRPVPVPATPAGQVPVAIPTADELAALRWLAQLAVNMVDYMDPDDYMTAFNWGSLGSQAFADANVDEWVYGTELPRLVLNEVYAKSATVGMMAPYSHTVNVWVELHNPFNPTVTNNSDQPFTDRILDNTAPHMDNLGGAAWLKLDPAGTTIRPYQVWLVRDNNNFRQRDNVTGDPVHNIPAAANNATFNCSAPPPATTGVTKPMNAISLMDDFTDPDPGMLPNTEVIWPSRGTLSANAMFNGNAARVPDPMDPNQEIYQNASDLGWYLIGPPASETLRDSAAPPGLPLAPKATLPTGNMQYTEMSDVDTPSPVTVVVRRLMCPHLPWNDPAVSPPYDPALPINKYITTDYFQDVVPNPDMEPVADRRSQGRLQPYASAVYDATPGAMRAMLTPPRVCNQDPDTDGDNTNGAPVAYTNQAQHTFFRHNSRYDPSLPMMPLTDTTLDIPFHWLVHLDRPLLNPLELLHVSAYKPHELLQQLIVGGAATDRSRHLAPWFDEETRLYRFLEFVECQPVSQLNAQQSRRAGKVNLNTITEPEVLEGLADAAIGGAWQSVYESRDTVFPGVRQPIAPPPFFQPDPAYFFGPGPGYIPIPREQQRTQFPIGHPEASPFWGLSLGPESTPHLLGPAQLVGATPTAIQQAKPYRFQPPATGGSRDTGLQKTWLRSRAAMPTERLFQDGSTTGHPIEQYNTLGRMSNNVTTRSNVFAVWITVGFFEVHMQPEAGLLTPVTMNNPLIPKLGAELGRSEGRHKRHRMFAIVDRSVIDKYLMPGHPDFIHPNNPNPHSNPWAKYDPRKDYTHMVDPQLDILDCPASPNNPGLATPANPGGLPNRQGKGPPATVLHWTIIE